MPSRSLFGLLPSLTLAWLVACDGTQPVALTAEDFRFVPTLVRVSASSPLTLSLYNAGRETHEFDSPILLYAANPILPAEKGESASGLVLAPGQSVQIVTAPPPGTYLFICRRKGHANMTGTLIVE
jgi:uncharacterized cupredoxin-like copper-binding protein